MSFVTLDLLIGLALFSAAFGGYRMGFIARAASWIGLAAGMIIAIRVLPIILRNVDAANSSDRLTVVVVAILGGALLGQIAGLFAGARLAAVVPAGPLRVGDRILGSVVGVFGVLVSVWLMLPLAANVQGWPAQQVRTSNIAAAIYDHAPHPPNAMATLRRLVGSSSFPEVFSGLQAAPETGPAPKTVPLSSELVREVAEATVRVEGEACRRTQDGSGFAVSGDLIVTNAHVVAGEKTTTVMSPNGREYAAYVVYFDAGRDLALLQVPDYKGRALPIGEAKAGEAGAVFGHPGGQSALSVQPALVSQSITAVGRDLYDRAQTRRDVLVLSANLQQGDSGSALVNTRGEVIGVAFAIAPDRPGTAYALSTDELRAALAAPRSGPVSTGACLSG